MTTNFQSILQGATVGQIEKPKPLPAGSYLAIIKNIEYGESSKQKTPYARINLELTAALEDVDHDELQAAGGCQGKKVKTDFYLTESALFMLQDFIVEHVGMEAEGISLDQVMPQLVNNQVGVKIKHEPSERNPEIVYSIVERTFRPE